MAGIDNKYIICPKCGCKLVDININNAFLLRSHSKTLKR